MLKLCEVIFIYLHFFHFAFYHSETNAYSSRASLDFLVHLPSLHKETLKIKCLKRKTKQQQPALEWLCFCVDASDVSFQFIHCYEALWALGTREALLLHMRLEMMTFQVLHLCKTFSFLCELKRVARETCFGHSGHWCRPT